MTHYYAIIVWGDIEPQLCGPFKTAEERDEYTHNHRDNDPSMNDGIYPMEITVGDPDWNAEENVSIDTYMGRRS